MGLYAALQTILGAGIGAGLVTAAIDYCKEKRIFERDKKHKGTFMAVRLAVLLEEYAEVCAGLVEENSNERDHKEVEQNPYKFVTQLPMLPEYPSDTAEGWLSLSPNQFSEVWSFRNRIAHAQAVMDHAIDDGEIPDQEFAKHASRLGLSAIKIAKDLRSSFSVPAEVPVWNYQSKLNDAKNKVAEG